MSIRCLAIDDEPLALRQLAQYIEKIHYLELVGQCHSALDAQQLMEREHIDAIFIDINMPDLNGLQFIRSLKQPPIVVLTTAYSEYALDGYKVNAVDYLLKPFSFDEFNQAAGKVKRQYELTHSLATDDISTRHDGNLFVKTEHRHVKISVADILYIEGMSEYVKIHFCNDTHALTILTSMKKLEDLLPPATFMRIHRSYIVNLNHVTEVNKSRVALVGDVTLPIGDLYRDVLRQYLDSHTLSK
ncbi:MAG: response regulator transcription factor [Prevotella sp.]|nr:response regulator transcription factor [Prevotella sp.]